MRLILCSKLIVILFLGLFIITNCKKDKETTSVIKDSIPFVPTPTYQLMENVWQVAEVRDANDSDITVKISPLLVPNLFKLDSMNFVKSTAGPLFMYIVYGDTRYISMISQIDQVFKYSDASFGLTEGEWGIIKDGVVDHFTIEIRQKFPTIASLVDILNLMGVAVPSFIEPTIYHKFSNVKVSINDANKDTMWWEFNNSTIPVYNVKDIDSNYVLWSGVSASSFSRCKIKLVKKYSTIEQLVIDAYSK